MAWAPCAGTTAGTVASSALSGYKVSDTMLNKPRRHVDLPKAAIEALWQGNLIGAITVVRQERNLGLKEAKGQVEVYIASQPALKKKMDKVLATVQQRFIRWVIGLLILAAGITLLVLYVL
jgi:ribosomal protein L7/L12